jgi:hypothetical protein
LQSGTGLFGLAGSDVQRCLGGPKTPKFTYRSLSARKAKALTEPDKKPHGSLSFLSMVKVLREEFRDMFLHGLEQTCLAHNLSFHGECHALKDPKAFAAFLEALKNKNWVVYAKPPFGGPEHALQYLALYTHRVAISNHRIVSIDDCHVTFQWKDYAHNNQQRTTPLTHEDFLRRFLQHLLPKGLPRIRYFGWPANRRRGLLLPLCRMLLHQDPNPTAPSDDPHIPHCPQCHGEMRIIERLTAAQLWKALQRTAYVLDTL